MRAQGFLSQWLKRMWGRARSSQRGRYQLGSPMSAVGGEDEQRPVTPNAMNISPVLPCNVVVEDRVEAVDPRALMDDPRFAELAPEAAARLPGRRRGRRVSVTCSVRRRAVVPGGLTAAGPHPAGSAA